MNIGFIGGGNMAEALIKGLVSRQGTQRIYVVEPSVDRAAYLEKAYGVRALDCGSELAAECPLIFLAVKPQVVEVAMQSLASGLTDDHLLVSILAGVTAGRIESLAGCAARVVRVMPNTPALVGEGAAALAAGSRSTDADLELVEQLFATIGRVVRCNEGMMDAVTGLSGSGPAYGYLFIEALADGGVAQGLPRDVALQLAAQTLLGAAAMVLGTGEHPGQLKDKVCSPGGTTIEAVRTLEANGFRSAVIEAVAAATRRSKELGGCN